MYEQFTDCARKVIQIANYESQRFNHEYIGTEHILLGLIREGSGVAATVLKNLNIDLREIRLEVEKLVQSGPDLVTMGKLPQTPRARKVIEYSILEAREVNHDFVGTEHILLGLIREQEGVAAQILMILGLTLAQVRAEVLNVLGLGRDKLPQGEERAEVRRGRLGDDGPPYMLGRRNYDECVRLIGFALAEAGKLNHDRMGAGHLLLAMLREPDGVFVRTINSLGLTVEIVRNEILRQLKQPPK